MSTSVCVKRFMMKEVEKSVNRKRKQYLQEKTVKDTNKGDEAKSQIYAYNKAANNNSEYLTPLKPKKKKGLEVKKPDVSNKKTPMLPVPGDDQVFNVIDDNKTDIKVNLGSSKNTYAKNLNSSGHNYQKALNN